MIKLRLSRIIVLVAAISIVVAVLLGDLATAVDNGGIGGKPANPRADNPRSESIFVYELEPGQQVEDAVKVVNNSESTKTILVYAVDSQIASGGAFACAQLADTPVAVGTWIEMSKTQVTLAPGTTEDVSFTVKVPSTAPVGEQNGCIAIQDAEQVPADVGNGITLSMRSAIRVAITIPGDINKQLAFSEAPEYLIKDDIVRITVNLLNGGNVSLDASINAGLYGLFGIGTQSVEDTTYPVLAASQGTFNFEFKRPFWGGWFNVKASATYSSESDHSIGEGGDQTTIYSPVKRVFIMPHPTALVIEILILLGILGGLGYVLWRYLYFKKLHAKAKKYKVKKGDSLQSIAKKHKTSWKLLAKLNKLSAPYHLDPLQEIKIPNPKKTESNLGKKLKKK